MSDRATRKQNVIEALNKARAMELQAIHQYMNQHYNLDDKDYGELAANMKLIAIDEIILNMKKFYSETYILISNYGSVYIYDMKKNEMIYEYKMGIDIVNIEVFKEKIFLIDRGLLGQTV